MNLRFVWLALLAVFGLAGLSAHAATSSTLRIQIINPNGVPIRDAVVEVFPAAGAKGPIRFPWRMAMAQRNQQFVPGTLVIARGSTVAFPNLDRVRHSIYSFSKPARFEIDLYGRDQTRSHRFPISGTVALGCNIHDGMRGYIRITETPFAGKTDGNGLITLSGLPAGSAQVRVWHPRLRAPAGEITETVSVNSGRQARKFRVRLR